MESRDLWSLLIFVAPALAPDADRMVWLLVAPTPAPAKLDIIFVGAKTGCSDRRYMRIRPNS